MAYPKDYKYTREHEWIQVNGNTATVGITDHAQESLGDIVFVELPKVGAQVEAGKSFGTVESVKAVSELYAPASGKVVEINESLNQGAGSREPGRAQGLDDQAGTDKPEPGGCVDVSRRLREIRRGREVNPEIPSGAREPYSHEEL